MNRKTSIAACLLAGLTIQTSSASAQALSIHIAEPGAPAPIDLTKNVSPSGEKIAVDSQSLWLGDKRWIPRMGEFHYARYKASEWRNELLKMKAGGINVISTYVFWIHHEEVKGKWDWSGDRNLRRFVQLCGHLGLKVFVRGGPWAHGEVRNGGLPDWLVKETKTRTDDPAYLAEVQDFYDQIGKQVAGLDWASGGPVIGFQVENEFYGSGDYLEMLKKMAIQAGIHAAIYTRTGWPALKSPVPRGELLPMYGGYPVGFWDRGNDENADKYGNNYVPSLVRNPDDIFQSDLRKGVQQPADLTYPYLCCEIGGGMMISYHRRVDVEPDEIGSLAMVKVASGSVGQGYYMYHGGTNPEGQLTYLNETQATNYWNDMPVKTYDFQAPLGEFGEVRDHYNILRRMHMFLEDFGPELAGMPAYMPDDAPQNSQDTTSLRWSVRSNGKSGVVFVNNFQRLKDMPAHSGVQFALNLPSGAQTIPAQPMDVPANSYFYFPFNWNLDGVGLRYATAQPVCTLKEKDGVSYFFAQIPKVATVFSFEAMGIKNSTGMISEGDAYVARNLSPSLAPFATFTAHSGEKVRVFLVSADQSLHMWKAPLAGKERVILSNDNLTFDDDVVTRYGDQGLSNRIDIYPGLKRLSERGTRLDGKPDGVFTAYDLTLSRDREQAVAFEKVKDPAAPRDIHMGSQGVAEQPSDADFEGAGVWKLHISDRPNRLIQIHYTGDAARLYLDGKLILDNFYNGKVMDFDPSYFGPDVYHKTLELKVLPLRKDSPIYLAPTTKAALGDGDSVCRLDSVQSVQRRSEILETR